MSEFRTSQLSSAGKASQAAFGMSSGARNNTLVVVVTKAQGLRNVLKMDKQSPFITIRIQDQEESTKVVPRGGQTPTFNDELWFNLDGVEDRILYINAYHQKKNDAKLICCGEVDFTSALKKSTAEGYDGWFDLYWEGREAGRVYLEITYYPKKGEVPMGTENAARRNMNRSVILPESARGGVFRNTPKEKTKKYTEHDDEIPELGQLSLDRSPGSGRFSHSKSRSASHSPIKKIRSNLEKFNTESPHAKESSPEESPSNNWFSFLDNTIKLPSILNNITFNSSINNGSILNGNKNRDPSLDSEFESRVKLKIESPELVKERPKKLFDSDDEEEDLDDISVTDKWKKSIASRQEPMIHDHQRVVSSITYQSNADSDDSDSDGEYTIGQAVDLSTSMRSSRYKSASNSPSPKRTNLPRLSEDEMSRSYRGRQLPEIRRDKKGGACINDDEDDDDDDDDVPPPIPKHMISMGSLFDSVTSAQESQFKLDHSAELPSTAYSVRSLQESNTPTASDQNLTWYEKRKLERRRKK